jgi:hypothetical protein
VNAVLDEGDLCFVHRQIISVSLYFCIDKTIL